VAPGRFRGRGADAGAAAGKAVAENSRAAGPRDGDEDQSDGFGARAAAGSRDAGDGDGVVGPAALPRAGGHGAGGLGTHGAMRGEDFRRNAQQAGFQGVRIGDGAPDIPGRTAGKTGQRGAEQAAGAGLGGGEGLRPRPQGGGQGG
jgi:hypothetical protein